MMTMKERWFKYFKVLYRDKEGTLYAFRLPSFVFRLPFPHTLQTSS